MPCSCYNSSASNDSAVFEKLSVPQFSRLGPLARPRHSTDLCLVPANSDIYSEVGRVWSPLGRGGAGEGVELWEGFAPQEAGPQDLGGVCK